MNKLKSMISYSCSTSLKYVAMFYAIIIVVNVLVLIIGGVTNGLEGSTLVYVSILGILGFKEEFKVFIQNGFTRKYIFIATVSLFIFISGIMAFADTIIGTLLTEINSNYYSMLDSIYGDVNIFMNFLILFMIYVFVCSVAYLIILINNKIGKTKSLYISMSIIGAIIILGVLYNRFVPQNVSTEIMNFVMKCIGLSANGTINFIALISTLLTLTLIINIGSYFTIKRTELK